MNTVPKALEQAIADLLRAKELAENFGHPRERVERIALIQRATCKVLGDIRRDGKQAERAVA